MFDDGHRVGTAMGETVVDGLLVRMNEQVPRLFEHTGVVALLDTEGKGKEAIGTRVLLHSRGCHWAVTAGHVAARVEKAGGLWGILVGGLGKAPRPVPIHSPFTVQSANSEEDEFEADLAVVKLHPREVDALYSAPRTKFYSGERAHRDYGPDANKAGTWGAHIMAGFHGERSARAAPTRAENPLVMITYPLARTGDRLTDKGRFIDFRVANAEASDQDVGWIDGEQPDYMAPRADPSRRSARNERERRVADAEDSQPGGRMPGAPDRYRFPAARRRRSVRATPRHRSRM